MKWIKNGELEKINCAIIDIAVLRKQITKSMKNRFSDCPVIIYITKTNVSSVWLNDKVTEN